MENFEERANVFAILSPANNAARDCFSQVAQKKLENEKWNPNARKNIKADKLPVQVSTYTNDSESDGGTEPSKTFRPVLKGCYTFNLAEAPRQPSKGWLIGGGKFSEGDESPDILLTERKTKFRVSSRHARLAHNFASGALVITVSDSSPVAINGYEVVDAQHVIHGRATSLEFGALKYSLEIRKYDTDEDYRSHLSFYKQKYGIMDDDYPWNLLATPADFDLVTQNYVLKNPVGESSTCVVYAAHNRSNGNAVAVKKVRRTKTNAGLIKQDINISKRIGSHPRIGHLIELIDPAAEDPNRGYKMFEVDEVFLVYTPLASWTIQKFIDAGILFSVEWREKIFWQLLEGIAYLHSIDIMHRDIKPLNMTVTSLNSAEPEARLIDFGAAQFGLLSDEYHVGTGPYLAPEMWAGFDGRTKNNYTEKVDLFAFGISMFQLFCQQPCFWQRIDMDQNGNECVDLLWAMEARLFGSDNPHKLMEWAVSFLDWYPQRRPSAEYILGLRDCDQPQRARVVDGTGHDEKDDGGAGMAASTEKLSLSGPGGILHDGDSVIGGSKR